MEQKQSSVIFGIVLGVVLLMLIAAGAYYFTTVTREQDDTAANNNGAVNSADGVTANAENENVNGEEGDEGTTETDGDDTLEDGEASIVDPGVTWLAEPERLDPLPLFLGTTGYDYYYFKIANLDDGSELITAVGVSMGTSYGRFIKGVDGTYSLIAAHSDEWYSTSPSETLQPSVRVDSTTVYQSLLPPTAMTLNGLQLKKEDAVQSGSFFDTAVFDATGPTIAQPEFGTIEPFAETAYGTVYVSVTPLRPETKGLALFTKKYMLVLSDTSVVYYTVDKEFVADDGTLIATFTTVGESFKERQFSRGIIADGCGGPTGDQFPAEVDIDQLTVIGATLGGKPLYKPKDSYEALLRIAYDQYTTGRNYPGSDVVTLSYEDVVAAQPLMMWKDNVGDYHLYRDIQFGPMAECGKPVIYLYPMQTTPVTVRVGAEVTVSEPVYGKGWSVVAQPDGTLTTSVGEVVRSLYWEGKGHGEYPKITVGTVVATVDVEQRIRTDLATMGLNSKEAQDFLDFWLPRMPQTPYVRLTWFTTAQMNQLAPLTITPRPQTLLRVFLDFEGQETALTTVAPQQLQRTERRGFTVVEWGGLLLGGR